MRPTKKTLEAIKEIEKKVAEVCDKYDGVVDEITGIVYPKTKSEESTSRKVEVKLSFGECAPSLKYQLEQQNFQIDKKLIKDFERARLELLALHEINILSSKQLFKCFLKLSKQISKMVVESTIKDGEIATHIKTIKL